MFVSLFSVEEKLVLRLLLQTLLRSDRVRNFHVESEMPILLRRILDSGRSVGSVIRLEVPQVSESVEQDRDLGDGERREVRRGLHRRQLEDSRGR